MNALLVAVTFGALGLAGALLFYVLRLTREERDRADARAAALTQMLEEGGPASGLQPSDISFQQAPMFGSATTEQESAGPGRWLVPAIGVVVVGLALTGIYVWNRPPGAAVAAEASAPLELVSLRHQRQGDTLIVSGLVRNPHAGRAVAGVSAIAFSFDRQGTFLASGRAPLDFPNLGAGDESPFSITVPQSAGVSRYRVSFRTEDRVVAHLDRRDAAVPASSQSQVTP